MTPRDQAEAEVDRAFVWLGMVALCVALGAGHSWEVGLGVFGVYLALIGLGSMWNAQAGGDRP